MGEEENCALRREGSDLGSRLVKKCNGAVLAAEQASQSEQ
jgi:hypothetical protein